MIWRLYVGDNLTKDVLFGQATELGMILPFWT
jgi:hypothetical protein